MDCAFLSDKCEFFLDQVRLVVGLIENWFILFDKKGSINEKFLQQLFLKSTITALHL